MLPKFPQLPRIPMSKVQKGPLRDIVPPPI